MNRKDGNNKGEQEVKIETLDRAEVGGVYNFDYKQPYGGDTHRHLARVVAVRRLTEADIHRIEMDSRWRVGDPSFERSQTIVTCQMPDGGFRNFYGERTENCGWSFLGWFLFRTGLARLAFRAKTA